MAEEAPRGRLPRLHARACGMKPSPLDGRSAVVQTGGDMTVVARRLRRASHGQAMRQEIPVFGNDIEDAAGHRRRLVSALPGVVEQRGDAPSFPDSCRLCALPLPAITRYLLLRLTEERLSGDVMKYLALLVVFCALREPAGAGLRNSGRKGDALGRRSPAHFSGQPVPDAGPQRRQLACAPRYQSERTAGSFQITATPFRSPHPASTSRRLLGP